MGRKAAKWPRRQGNGATSGGPVRTSQHRCSVCGQEPRSPRNCSWALIKTWELGEAEMSCLFLKPQLHFLGLLSGRASSLCLRSVYPTSIRVFGKNCCLAEKPWEALLCLLRNRKSLFAQSKQTHKLQGSRSVQSCSPRRCVCGLRTRGPEQRILSPPLFLWPNKQLR